MNVYFLTAEGGLLGPIIFVFGKLMNGIFIALDKIGIGNILQELSSIHLQ